MKGQSTDDTDLPRTREDVWQRLSKLLDAAERGGLDKLSDRQVEDLGRLYRATATHLALMRGFGATAGKLERLNRLVSRGHRFVYGRPKRRSASPFVKWIVFGAAEAVRRTWRFHALAFALLLIGGLYGFLGASQDPEWSLEFRMPGDTRTAYATRAELLESLHRGRAGEVGSAQKTAFASMLWAHNTKVAILAFFLGALCAVPSVLLLLYNGILLGVYTWIHHSKHLDQEWWAWILPHGVTELGAIILLSGGGLWIGSLVIAPGERSRTDAFRAARGTIVQLLMLAFPMLLLAALLESFLRQSALGTPARFVVAAVTAVLWAAYFVFSRVPHSFGQRAGAARSLAERKVPLPAFEEMAGL